MPMYSRIYLPFSAQQCFCAKMKHLNISYQTFWSCKRVLQIRCMLPENVLAWTWYDNIWGAISNILKVCGFPPVINKTLTRNISLPAGIYCPLDLQLLYWKSDGLSLYLISLSNTLTTTGNQLDLWYRLYMSNRAPLMVAVESPYRGVIRPHGSVPLHLHVHPQRQLNLM